MRLTLPEAVARLAASAEVLRALVDPVDAEQARWKPAPDAWSILEVVNHLADEEAEDFRARLDLLLHHPGQPWPPIDPEGWVTARDYAGRGLAASLDRFLAERRRSLDWLAGLDAPDWERAYPHPRAGPLSAGSLLASWVAHDLLHVRQLARLHHQYTAARAHPHPVAYAGRW